MFLDANYTSCGVRSVRRHMLSGSGWFVGRYHTDGRKMGEEKHIT